MVVSNGPNSDAGDETIELVRELRLTNCSFHRDNERLPDDIEAYVHLKEPLELLMDSGEQVKRVVGGVE